MADEDKAKKKASSFIFVGCLIIGLGVGIGQLRALGEAGELTAEKVIGALRSQTAVLTKEFANIQSA